MQSSFHVLELRKSAHKLVDKAPSICYELSFHPVRCADKRDGPLLLNWGDA